ncbi:MAG: hypothetical protein GY719_26560 [bacterium]|nr:hypothetical protein [bacterium]
MAARMYLQAACFLLSVSLIPEIAGADGGAARLNLGGAELQVNYYTTSTQGYPAVAVDAVGGFESGDTSAW